MLKCRVIPCLTFREGLVVKSKQFKDHRPVGPLVQAVRLHNMRDVDELILLDIGEPDEPDYELIAEACENCYMPVTVGGGIKTIAHIRNLLNNGADKVCIRTHRELIEEAVKVFGSQCIVACIDFGFHGGWYKLAASHAKAIAKLGAGEIIIQSIEFDGMMGGYDLELVKEVSSAVTVPVIALGGAGEPEDFTKAIEAGASAAAGSAIFIWTQTTPRDVAIELQEQGIPVRT